MDAACARRGSIWPRVQRKPLVSDNCAVRPQQHQVLRPRSHSLGTLSLTREWHREALVPATADYQPLPQYKPQRNAHGNLAGVANMWRAPPLCAWANMSRRLSPRISGTPHNRRPWNTPFAALAAAVRGDEFDFPLSEAGMQ